MTQQAIYDPSIALGGLQSLMNTWRREGDSNP